MSYASRRMLGVCCRVLTPNRLSGQVWIYKGRRAEDELYRGMWERAMDEMLDRLVYKNEASGLTYVAEIRRCGAPQCSLPPQGLSSISPPSPRRNRTIVFQACCPDSLNPTLP